jgi:hypothetical protein
VVAVVAALAMIVLAFLILRRRRARAGDSESTGIAGPSTGAGGPPSVQRTSLSDGEIASWRRDRGGARAPFIRVTSTLVRLASIGGGRRASTPGTPAPNSARSSTFAGGPVSMRASVVPPVPALPHAPKPAVVEAPRISDVPSVTSLEIASWRPGGAFDPFADVHAPLVSPVEADAQALQIDADWAPPASRMRRKPSPLADAPAPAPAGENPFLDPAPNVQTGEVSRLSTVSQDLEVPAGEVVRAYHVCCTMRRAD